MQMDITNQVSTNLSNSLIDNNCSQVTSYYNTLWNDSLVNFSTSPFMSDHLIHHYVEVTVISKLPIIFKVKEAVLLKNNKILIDYRIPFNKYFPNDGTLYLSKYDLYCIYNKEDDKYWDQTIILTYNSSDLEIKNVDMLKNSYGILMNDENCRLSNEEIERLIDIKKFKNFAHELLEKSLISDGDKLTKNYKSTYHSTLNNILLEL